ncbi:MAG: ribonuclease P protein component 1 [Candidatus Bathyarchaeia archaeon]
MTEVNPFNLVRHELIGLEAKIVKSTNRQIVGLKGKIVDETRNILTFRSGGRDLKIPKNIVQIRFYLPNGEIVDVEGKVIQARPEDRVKMRVRRW